MLVVFFQRFDAGQPVLCPFCRPVAPYCMPPQAMHISSSFVQKLQLINRACTLKDALKASKGSLSRFESSGEFQNMSACGTARFVELLTFGTLLKPWSLVDRLNGSNCRVGEECEDSSRVHEGKTRRVQTEKCPRAHQLNVSNTICRRPVNPRCSRCVFFIWVTWSPNEKFGENGGSRTLRVPLWCPWWLLTLNEKEIRRCY